MVKRKLRPNVVRGGIAIPLGSNYYYMQGRKHSNGGIDIGNNAKTGIEVEGGEVVKTSPNNIKVFSSVPILNGESPAEKVIKGDNPNAVFKAQENFKDRNKINNDGSRKARAGGSWRSSNSIRNRIARWEGSSMKTNNSFENEDAGFINAIPYNVRRKMSQRELDALYSYSYNVGSGNFKARVVPALVNLYSGKGSVKAVQQSMWASRDNELPGLAKRRRVERQLFADAYYNRHKNVDYNDVMGTGADNSKDGNNEDIPDKNYVTDVEAQQYAANAVSEVLNKQQAQAAEQAQYKLKARAAADQLNKALGQDEESIQATNDAIALGQAMLNEKPAVQNTAGTGFTKIQLKMGGLSRKANYGSSKKPYPSVSKNDFAGGGRSYPIPTRADAVDALRLAGLHGRSDVKAKVYAKYPDLRKKAKVGGYYTIQSGGQTVVRIHPSTGSQKRTTVGDSTGRDKFASGGIRFAPIGSQGRRGLVGDKRNGRTSRRITYVKPRYVRQGDFMIDTKTGKRTQSAIPLRRVSPEFEVLTLGRGMATDASMNAARYTAGRSLGFDATAGARQSAEILANGTRNLVSKAAQAGKKLVSRTKRAVNDIKTDVKVRKQIAANKGTEPTYTKFTDAQGRPQVTVTRIPKKPAETPTKTNVGESIINEAKSLGRATKAAVDQNAVKPLAYSSLATAGAGLGWKGAQAIMDNLKKGKKSNSVLPKANNSKPAPKQTNSQQTTTEPATEPIDNTTTPTTAEPVQTSSQLTPRRGSGSSRSSSRSTKPAKTTTTKSTTPAKSTKPVTPAKTATPAATSTTPSNSNVDLTRMGSWNRPERDDAYNYPFAGNNWTRTPKDQLQRNIESYNGNGGSTTPRRSSFRNWMSRNNITNNDLIGLGSNIIGGLASALINRGALNKMRYASAPVQLRAPKLKTTININPQLDKMRESLAEYERNIDSNTASSSVALARKQQARLANVIDTNSLYGNKENSETELINADRTQQANVANNNIQAYNQWNAGRADFENNILDQRASNAVGYMDTLNQGVQDVVGRVEQRTRDNNTIKAMIAAHPNVSPLGLRAFGLPIDDNTIIQYYLGQGKSIQQAQQELAKYNAKINS